MLDSESSSFHSSRNSDRRVMSQVDSSKVCSSSCQINTLGKLSDAMDSQPSTALFYPPQPDFLNDNEISSSSSTTHGHSLKIKSSPQSINEASTSSVRKLLARQIWRKTSKSSPIGSAIIGPILLSFDDSDDTDEKQNEVNLLLDFDGLDTSYLDRDNHDSAIDIVGTSKIEEYDALKNERSAPSAFTKVQSIFTRRRHIPDPNRAISNLFGVKLNPLAAPNLLDKVSTDEGVELSFTNNNSTGFEGSVPENFLFKMNTNNAYIAKPLLDRSTVDRSNQAHEFASEKIEQTKILASNGMYHDGYATLAQMKIRDHIDHDGSCIVHEMDVHERHSWRRLNILLTVSYACTSFAGSATITLVPSIASDLFQSQSTDSAIIDASASNFVSVIASYAVFSSALGKFINGPLGDVFGARRVSCIYSLLFSASLILLSFSHTENSVILYCSALEFTQSVQWPCMAIILASHYGEQNSEEFTPHTLKSTRSNYLYEKAVYEVSIGARVGQLLASFITTLFLHYYMVSWRTVCRLAAQVSFLSCVLFYFFVFDSPTKRHKPQNPVRELNTSSLGTFIFKAPSSYLRGIEWVLRVFVMILVRNIFPSLRSVLSSATFWIVAVAHSGGSIILSSGRILGSYFTDTSDGKVSIDQAGEFTAFLSLGIFLGLAVGGKSFSSLSTDGRERKNFIQRKYMMSIVMCYILSLLAIPTTRALLHSQFLVTLLQIVSTFLMGAGVAVQLYCIPAIVGTNFGANKGLYFSYTDGVAYLVGSMVWVLVAGAVAEGNPKGSGWAYGWAAIAILVILAGWLMVEFVGRYFSHEESIARREQELNAPQKQPDDRSVYIDSSQENSHEANISASQIVTL